MGSSYRSKMSSKGQLVIPSEVRKRLGLRSGTQVTITEDNGRLIIEQRRQIFEEIFQLRGILKGQDESLAKLIQEDRQLERDHFERLERLAARKR